MDKPVFLLILCAALLVLLFIAGVIEKKRNDKNLKKLKLTINVNGIRGKSTATRLITSVLWAAGYRAVGKTTGTAARMMYWDTDEEEEVIRRPHGVTISEQIRVIDKAASCGANALVCECMAVRPEYQRIYQHNIIHANITVITNVLEDHIDEMGPTTKQIAWAFGDTIPYNGIVVIPGCGEGSEFRDYFHKIAAERNTKVFEADDNLITPEFLAKFDYEIFPRNCSVALAVADALGIDREVAFEGMLKAHPDPGALRIYELKHGDDEFVLANAFAANEPTSSFDIYNIVRERYGAYADNPLIIMNCRPDRVDRTKQFVADFFPKIPNATLIGMGQNTGYIRAAYKKHKLSNLEEYIDLDRVEPEIVLDTIAPLLKGRVVICVGNIHGFGYPLLEALLEYGGHTDEAISDAPPEENASSHVILNEEDPLQ